MSRVANNPITIPKGVEINIAGQAVTVKGGKGTMAMDVHPAVKVVQEDNILKFTANESMGNSDALAGTTRALLNNMVT